MYGISTGAVRKMDPGTDGLSDLALRGEIEASYREHRLQVWSCQVAVFVAVFGLIYAFHGAFETLHWLSSGPSLAAFAAFYLVVAHRVTVRIVVAGIKLRQLTAS